jgi:phosphoribosyl-AMP cyclohydrolase / phosphoribosyl-ATP pyrophosphohydrolase
VDPSEIEYDDRGLAPAVVQDASTGDVLMLAYVNEEALRRTIDSGTTWFWSRSREEYWNKGATSGNVQKIVDVRYDCDADTLLFVVNPAGPACHTGEKTCFYRSFSGAPDE